MLVIGPSLPVLRYLWSFSRSRQPLRRHWRFRPGNLATNPLPFSIWYYLVKTVDTEQLLAHLRAALARP